MKIKKSKGIMKIEPESVLVYAYHIMYIRFDFTMLDMFYRLLGCKCKSPLWLDYYSQASEKILGF